MDLNIFMIQFQTRKIAKYCKNTGNYCVSAQRFVAKHATFSPIFVRWAGVGGMPSTPPMAKATGEWPSAQHGPAGFKG